MSHFYLYLAIIVLAKALTLAVVALARQRRRTERPDCSLSDTPAHPEPFTCLEADLKEVNEGVFLCRMRFANEASRRLKFEGRSLKEEV
ncbi:MAG: hypothetical protein OXU26_10430 [Acidobacteriota bacterium]|nr:hypothetical protein [Acidobacteriota bacterium]MDE2964320.1 hypothetical protein [Acidobacteriota bacterium]